MFLAKLGRHWQYGFVACLGLLLVGCERTSEPVMRDVQTSQALRHGVRLPWSGQPFDVMADDLDRDGRLKGGVDRSLRRSEHEPGCRRPVRLDHVRAGAEGVSPALSQARHA